MKVLIVALWSLWAITVSPLLPSVSAKADEQRTPVSCSGKQFFFGSDIVLATDAQHRLFSAETVGWQQLHTPAGEHDVGVGGGIIYLHSGSIYQAADPRAIYRSLDRGATWTRSGESPDVQSWTEVYPSPTPDTLFLAAGGFSGWGIYRSTDAGANWTHVLAEGYGGAVVFSPGFAQDGIASTTAHAFSTPNFTVFVTSDLGETWTQFGPRNNLFGAIARRGGMAFSPQFPTDRTAFTDGLGETGLFKTTDGMTSWIKVNDAQLAGSPAFSPTYIYDQTFIAGLDENLSGPNRTVLISRDGGRTLTAIWQRGDMTVRYWGVSEPLTQAPQTELAIGPHRLYLPLVYAAVSRPEFWLVAQEDASSRACYLYHSRDLGATWEEVVLP